jgi:hypothetical protein
VAVLAEVIVRPHRIFELACTQVEKQLPKTPWNCSAVDVKGQVRNGFTGT